VLYLSDIGIISLLRRKKLLIIAIGFVFVLQPLSAQTWEKSKRLTWNSGDSMYPAVAVDSSDHIHVVWNDGTPSNAELFYKKSTNEGVAWSSSKRLTWNSGDSYNPAIAADSNDNIYLIWNDITSGFYEIYYKKSSDSGMTWGSSKRLTWNSSNSITPSIVVDTSDTIHLVWEDYAAGNHEIYYKRSTNGGATWGNSDRLTWNPGFSWSAVIAVDLSNTIHVVWYDKTSGNSEIYYKKGIQ